MRDNETIILSRETGYAKCFLFFFKSKTFGLGEVYFAKQSLSVWCDLFLHAAVVQELMVIFLQLFILPFVLFFNLYVQCNARSI